MIVKAVPSPCCLDYTSVGQSYSKPEPEREAAEAPLSLIASPGRQLAVSILWLVHDLYLTR